MGSILRQVAAVTAMNLKSIPHRLWLSTATVVSVALVVAVLLAFLAMARGFETTVVGTGAEDVAVVMRTGAQAEISSVLTLEQVRLLAEAPGVRRRDGRPLASAELYTIVDGVKRGSGTEANLPLRGLGPEGLALRPTVRVVQGRMARPGTNELTVGRGVVQEFAGFDLDATVVLNAVRWQVVGVFEAGGGVFESEIWADAPVVQSLFNRQGSFQTLRLQLERPEALSAVQAYVDADPRLKLTVMSERGFFAEQSSGSADLIFYLGWPLAVVMAFGALAGALNTMMSAVASRTREIATLRAIGFGGLPAFVGTLAESLALAAIGGVAGAGLAYLAFDGLTASTLGGGFTQIVFRFALTPDLVGQGIALALAIGLLGGLAPAWRAARVPIVAAVTR